MSALENYIVTLKLAYKLYDENNLIEYYNTTEKIIYRHFDNSEDTYSFRSQIDNIFINQPFSENSHLYYELIDCLVSRNEISASTTFNITDIFQIIIKNNTISANPLNLTLLKHITDKIEFCLHKFSQYKEDVADDNIYSLIMHNFYLDYPLQEVLDLYEYMFKTINHHNMCYIIINYIHIYIYQHINSFENNHDLEPLFSAILSYNKNNLAQTFFLMIPLLDDEDYENINNSAIMDIIYPIFKYLYLKYKSFIITRYLNKKLSKAFKQKGFFHKELFELLSLNKLIH